MKPLFTLEDFLGLKRYGIETYVAYCNQKIEKFLSEDQVELEEIKRRGHEWIEKCTEARVERDKIQAAFNMQRKTLISVREQLTESDDFDHAFNEIQDCLNKADEILKAEGGGE